MTPFFYFAAGGMIIGSIATIIWPEKVWYLSEGWRYKNLEPSEQYLRASRIGGFVGLIIGVIILIWIDDASRYWPSDFP